MKQVVRLIYKSIFQRRAGTSLLSWRRLESVIYRLFIFSSFYGGIARSNPAQSGYPLIFILMQWKSTNKNIARNAISPLHVRWEILPIASAAQ
jgi:hypothetical protein